MVDTEMTVTPTQQPDALRRDDWRGDGMTRTTSIKINHRGDVKLWHDYGYMVVGGPDAVCFYIDVDGRADITGWTKSDANCPVIFIGNTCADTDTIAEFTEFPGWRVHATNGGKTLAVALVREGAEE